MRRDSGSNGDFSSENPLVAVQDAKAEPPGGASTRANAPGTHGSMSIAATAAAAMMATQHRAKASKRNSMLTGVRALWLRGRAVW